MELVDKAVGGTEASLELVLTLAGSLRVLSGVFSDSVSNSLRNARISSPKK